MTVSSGTDSKAPRPPHYNVIVLKVLEEEATKGEPLKGIAGTAGDEGRGLSSAL